MAEKLATDMDNRIWRALVGAFIGGFFGRLAGWVIAVAMHPRGVWTFGPPAEPFWPRLVVYALCITSGAFIGMALTCWRDLPEEGMH